MKHVKQGGIVILLMGILAAIIGGTLKNAITYYRSADYAINSYIKYLNRQDYESLYKWLDPDSLKSIEGKEDFVAYYERMYQRENQLVRAEKVSRGNGTSYQVMYQYIKGNIKESLEVVYTKEHQYRITFPFESTAVEVFAPYGAQVYLGDMKMTYSEESSYALDNVLPGKYLLKVNVNQAGYTDYYQVMNVPSDKECIVPYDVAHLTIYVPAGFKVTCNEFIKWSQNGKVEFSDILLGTYQITIEDELGIYEPQVFSTQIKVGENTIHIEDLALSDQGKIQLKTFWSTFYGDYIKAVREHNAQLIASYFSSSRATANINEFSSWYIDQKDIENATLQVKIQEYTIDTKGYIHVKHTEQSELDNREYDELGDEKLQTYKIVLTWETVIDPYQDTYMILERTLCESMVAMQDVDGKWIQY